MAFDPDAYLAEKDAAAKPAAPTPAPSGSNPPSSPGGFDPDAYLAEKTAKPSVSPPADTSSTPSEPAPKIGRLKAGVATTLQGASFGTSDELKGVSGAVGDGIYTLLHEHRLPTTSEIKKAYTEDRDTERADVAQAKIDYPKQSLATEIAGGFFVPIPGAGAVESAKGVATAAKATGLGMKAFRAAKALAPAAATGALAGVGYQDSGKGDIASAGDVAKAAGEGAGTGVVVDQGLKAVGRGIKAVATGGRSADELKNRVLNIIGKSPDGAKATPTDRAFLQKAGEGLMNEMTTGPDAEVVQNIVFHPKSSQALEQLEPVLDNLRTHKTAQYDKFQAAGVSKVDAVGEYLPRIQETIDKLDAQGGHERQVVGLEGIRDFVAKKAAKVESKGLAAKENAIASANERLARGEIDATQHAAELAQANAAGSPTDLKWFRALQTDFGNEAASKLGNLEPHIAAREGAKVAHQALEVFDDILSSKAAGNPELEEAANAIRADNERFASLLPLQKALTTKARTEIDKNVGPATSVLNKLHKVGTIGAGMAGFAVGGPLGAAAAVGAGAALPKIAESLDRRITAKSVEELRGVLTGTSKDGWGAVSSRIANKYNVPEKAVRALYLRMLGGYMGPNSDQE